MHIVCSYLYAKLQIFIQLTLSFNKAMPCLVRSSSEFLFFTRKKRKIAMTYFHKMLHDDAEHVSYVHQLSKYIISNIQDGGPPVN